MKLFKLIILLLASNYLVSATFGQANPYIQVLPANSGLVSLNATLNLQITIGNTGTASIPAFKLRPVITIPAIVNFLPDADQTPGLPAGWSIVSSTLTQIRICNGTDVIAGSSSRIITLKVKGVAIGGPSTFSGQMNFGGASCAVAGSAPSGNVTADDNATSTIQVVAGCSLGVTATAGTILCNGGTANITAAVTNATGAVEYSITRSTGPSAFQASNIFLNEPAGTYTITAREVANPSTCVAISVPVIIDDVAAISAPVVSIVQPTCSIATGIVTITSATTGLTFSIDGSASYDTYTGGIPLPAGSHTIRARNSNLCLSPITTFTINAQPVTPAAPAIGTITQPNCIVSTGAVVLSGLPLGDWTINPGNITGNTASITLNNLPAGTYNYTVTNNVGCSSIPSASVTLNAVLGAPAAPIVVITQPTCTVATATITVTSPTAGLTFSLDSGLYGVYPIGGFTGILPGSHTLILQNASGCLSPFTNITINPQPASPAAPIVVVTQPTCTVSTGIITVTSDTIGNTFSLNTSLFAAYPTGGYVVPAGTYNLSIQNNSGCIPSTTNNIIVNVQPASPTGIASATTITCSGGTSTLSVVATGGVLPYEYRLSSGFQSANTFNVGAGTYTVTVKDANGCTGNTNSLAIVQPAVIAASISTGSIACRGGNTTLTVLATGGSGALEYSLNNTGIFQPSNIFNNVVAGSYSVKVRPIANPACITTTASITLLQPDSLKATASALAINQCGGTTEVKVLATGGKAPYTGTGSFTRGPGTWSFTVTDANGCTTTAQQTILAPGCVYIKVFPNPAQNNITVNHPASEATSTIQIFGINGAMVLSKSIPQKAFITPINIATLASGTYLLVYVSGSERKEIKFIKANIK